MDMKNYERAVRFLESLNPLPKEMKEKKEKMGRGFYLERTKQLFRLLENPHKDIKIIHIAGTSGKGSVALMTHKILHEAGIRTGAFISPHISTLTERIRVGDKLISPYDLTNLLNIIKPLLKKSDNSLPYGRNSFFETLLAIAFLYFKQEKCEYVILEAGVGGTFDATNVAEATKMAVITNIGLDHTNLLGRTKKEIAIKKSGIIKKGSFVITGEKDPALRRIIKDRALDKGAEFLEKKKRLKIIKTDIKGTDFRYGGELFQTRLIGRHQAENAVLSIEAAAPFLESGYSPKKTLENIILPGRLEKLQDKPMVILDGAHNKDKIKSTARFIKDNFSGRLHLVIALAEGKDSRSILKNIHHLADNIYLTTFLSGRRGSQPIERLESIVKDLDGGKAFESFINNMEAVRSALNKASDSDMVLITGSIFLAANIRRLWYPEEGILKNRKMF